jgi:hypothetical protein
LARNDRQKWPKQAIGQRPGASNEFSFFFESLEGFRLSVVWGGANLDFLP